jgi:hypothetical protein
MVRGSCCFAIVLFCGAIAACSVTPSEDDVDAALTGGQSSGGVEGGTGGATASGGSVDTGGSGGTGGAVGTGGSGGTGGTVGTGGSIGTGGTVGTGGSGGSGGTVGSGGIVGAGGSIDGGGIVGQGGRTGTGGAGNTGSTPMQGGTTGSATTTPVDLTCNTDDDCCVRVDTCRAIAVLYSKIQGLVYWPPSTSTSCLRCFTPVVEVSCKNNQCTGTVVDPMGSGTSHCGKLPSTGSGGTTGTTTRTGAVDIASPATPAFDTSRQLVFGCG